jgi:hypothetical protein
VIDGAKALRKAVGNVFGAVEESSLGATDQNRAGGRESNRLKLAPRSESIPGPRQLRKRPQGLSRDPQLDPCAEFAFPPAFEARRGKRRRSNAMAVPCPALGRPRHPTG